MFQCLGSTLKIDTKFLLMLCHVSGTDIVIQRMSLSLPYLICSKPV